MFPLKKSSLKVVSSCTAEPTQIESHAGKISSFIRQLILNIILAGIGVFAALIAVEAGFRLLGLDKKVVWSDRPTRFYKPENSPNMQDYFYPAQKEPGVFRIAVVGDSFTFAPYMQFDDSFPKKLERMLNLNSSAPKTEVLNYGVPGYSTTHEVDTVRTAIVSHHADLVLLQITLNDPQLKAYRPTGLSGKNDYASYNSSRERGFLSHWKSLQMVRARLYNNKTHRAYKRYYFRLFNEKGTPWRSFVKAVKRIRRIGQRNKVNVAAVIFPLFGLPLDDSYPFLPIHDKINSLCEKLGIPHLDLFESYKGIPLERLQVVPKMDFHPNEIGHRIAAERIYDWLEQQELIPQKLAIKAFFPTRMNIRPKRNIR